MYKDLLRLQHSWLFLLYSIQTKDRRQHCSILQKEIQEQSKDQDINSILQQQQLFHITESGRTAASGPLEDTPVALTKRIVLFYRLKRQEHGLINSNNHFSGTVPSLWST